MAETSNQLKNLLDTVKTTLAEVKVPNYVYRLGQSIEEIIKIKHQCDAYIARCHLEQAEAERDAIREILTHQPGTKSRTIADRLNLNEAAVAKVREQLIHTIPAADTILEKLRKLIIPLSSEGFRQFISENHNEVVEALNKLGYEVAKQDREAA